MRIVQRIVCVGARDRRWCSARGLNYIRTFTAQATVTDASGPTVSVIADNPFTRGEWVRGPQSVTYDTSDNVGVRLAQPVIGGIALDRQSRSCNYAQRIPCPNGPGTISISTINVAEGTQLLAVVAEDAGGNASTSSAATVRIDNAAPSAVPVGIDGGDAWRNRNDFDLAWTNPPEGDRAPDRQRALQPLPCRW